MLESLSERKEKTRWREKKRHERTQRERISNSEQERRGRCDTGCSLRFSFHFPPPSGPFVLFVVLILSSLIFYFSLLSFNIHLFLKKRETVYLKTEEVKLRRNDALSPFITVCYSFEGWRAGCYLFPSFLSMHIYHKTVNSSTFCPKDTQHFLIFFDGDRWRFLPKLRRQVRRQPIWNSHNPDYQRKPSSQFSCRSFNVNRSVAETLRAQRGKCW